MTVPFTKYEAAYLLNAYLEGEKSGTPRYRTAERCSGVLRQMAVKQGQRIDDTYRTAAGIVSRIMSMESAYKGETITHPSTQLFAKIVEMYRSDREGYDKLLREAKRMVESAIEEEAVAHEAAGDVPEHIQVDKNAFFEWLHINQHMAEATCRSYVSAVHRAEMYAMAHGFEPKRLYTLNLQEAVATAKALFQDPGFCQDNAKQHNSFTAAIKKWLAFLSDVQVSDEARCVSNRGCGNSVIPEKLLLSIQQYYGNGMRFDDTVIRLLEECSGTKIDQETKNSLQNYMFCRSDGLYFLPEMVGEKEQLELLKRKTILEKIENFGCVDLGVLYSDFCNCGAGVCLGSEGDLADYLSFTLSQDVRAANALGTKIIRKIGTSINETLEESASKVICAIKERECVTQDEILLQFPVFSKQFIHGLLEKYTDEIIPIQINDCLCYQTVESIGLAPDFSATLNETLEEIDKLSLLPSQDIIHAMLSVKLGYNLMDEFNILDKKTFCRIISTCYTGDRLRVWRTGCFREVNDNHV